MASTQVYTPKHITTGTTTIKGPGVLGCVVINKALTGTVTVSDVTGTLAVLTNGTTAPLGVVMFGGPDGGVSFTGNLTVALSGTEDITVCYR